MSAIQSLYQTPSPWTVTDDDITFAGTAIVDKLAVGGYTDQDEYAFQVFDGDHPVLMIDTLQHYYYLGDFTNSLGGTFYEVDDLTGGHTWWIGGANIMSLTSIGQSIGNQSGNGTTLNIEDNVQTISYLASIGHLFSGPILSDNDIEITDNTKGIILKAPDSSRHRITVANNGTLISTPL